MGKLSTHVLDTMHGRPAKGVRLQLYALQGLDRRLVLETATNADGRCDQPLLQGQDMQPGMYELLFHVGDYFASQGVKLTEPRFLDSVPVRFGIANTEENYHVPLVLTPWTYSTYRGS